MSLSPAAGQDKVLKNTEYCLPGTAGYADHFPGNKQKTHFKNNTEDII